MKYSVIPASFLCLILLSGCPEDNNEPGILNDEQRQIQNEVLDLQQNSFSLLTDLQQEMSLSEAIDLVLDTINSDPSVDWAKSNKQGIFIQYKSGIKGGIFINNEMKVGEKIDPESGLKSKPIKGTNNLTGTSNQRKFPPTKNSVYVSPIYDALGSDEEFSILSTEIYLSTTDYSDLKRIINEAATVEWFTQVDKYGIIVISSDGFNTFIDDYNTETYLLTGETVNESTSAKFWSEIKDGLVPLIYTRPGEMGDENYYWISPGFITKYNDLVKDTAFIYGGFSNSFLGTWPAIIGTGSDKFGGYMGYEGSIMLETHYAWLADLMLNMTDLTASQSMTCDDWINGTTIRKSVYNPVLDESFKISYNGILKLALTEKKVPPYNYCILKASVRGRSQFNDGTYANWQEFFGNKKITGAFIDENTFEATWSEGQSSADLRITGNFGTQPVITDVYYHRITKDYDTYTEHIVSSDINLIGSYPGYGGVLFDITGEPTCNLFTELSYKVDGGDGVYTREMISYECNNDSFFNIVLGEEDK